MKLLNILKYFPKKILTDCPYVLGGVRRKVCRPGVRTGIFNYLESVYIVEHNKSEKHFLNSS